jgi:endonuclease V-like protein UPF0215 family
VIGLAIRSILAVEGGRFATGMHGKSPAAFLATRGIVPRRLAFREVEGDGLDATERTLEVLSDFLSLGIKTEVLMSGSVPIAGFNLIDPQEVLRKAGVPSIFVLKDRPDSTAVKGALSRHFADWERRLAVIEGAGEVHAFMTPGGEGEEVIIECVGISPAEAFMIARGVTVFGRVPEPVRLARMVAKALGDALRDTTRS